MNYDCGAFLMLLIIKDFIALEDKINNMQTIVDIITFNIEPIHVVVLSSN